MNPSTSSLFLFIGLGIFLGLVASFFVVKFFKDDDWLRASAKVTRSDYLEVDAIDAEHEQLPIVDKIYSKIEIDIKEQEKELRARGHGGRHTSYLADIEYVYSVGSQEFVGKNMNKGLRAFFQKPQLAKEALKKYPVGTQMTIFYNPNTPEESFIESSAPWINKVPWILGIMGGLVASAFYLIFWLKSRFT